MLADQVLGVSIEQLSRLPTGGSPASRTEGCVSITARRREERMIDPLLHGIQPGHYRNMSTKAPSALIIHNIIVPKPFLHITPIIQIQQLRRIRRHKLKPIPITPILRREIRLLTQTLDPP